MMPHMVFPACVGTMRRLYTDYSLDPRNTCKTHHCPSEKLTVSRTALKTQLQSDAIEYILVQFVDIHGCPKVKMVPADFLDDVADVGAGFAGGAVWGMGQDASSHDMMARVDLASYTPLPWKPGMARFASDLYVDGKPHPFCSRVNLKRVLSEVRAAGFVFNVGVEPEHFLV